MNPPATLTPETSAIVEDILFGLNEQGQTLIVVTHDEDLAAKCARQIRIQDVRSLKHRGESMKLRDIFTLL